MGQVADHLDGLHRFRSSYSFSGGGDCVEVAAGVDSVFVRDSKAGGDGPVLRVGRGGWAAFLAHAAEWRGNTARSRAVRWPAPTPPHGPGRCGAGGL
ncbi:MULTISPECIES: DUF397 domain-containing protein [unclassified Streptomyces]|jgi:hypothetical protein|uniref:DUF397 domain-containing protein n=1 Tax=Streptomyces thermocoprophilus TaxID=78356 RepID=A0ABV5V7U0_9ACTN